MDSRVGGGSADMDEQVLEEPELESMSEAMSGGVASRSLMRFQRGSSARSTEAGRAVGGRCIDGMVLGVKSLL